MTTPPELAKVLFIEHESVTNGELEIEELDARWNNDGHVRSVWTLVAVEALCHIEDQEVERAGDLRAHVIEFHRLAGQPVRSVPTIAPDEEVRLRLRLVTEEWREFVEACGIDVPKIVKARIDFVLDSSPIVVDLPKLADALADIDYVVEGTRLHFGIYGGPIAEEVHRANVSKFGPGSSKRWDGKVQKPEGWLPPDISKVLLAQGWKP